jgi:cold shock CspA family protein
VKHLRENIPERFKAKLPNAPWESDDSSFRAAGLHKFSPRHEGRITAWTPSKGYGFVANDDGSGDLFFGKYEAARLGAIEIGTRVQFSIGRDPGARPHAVNMRRLEEPAA